MTTDLAKASPLWEPVILEEGDDGIVLDFVRWTPESATPGDPETNALNPFNPQLIKTPREGIPMNRQFLTENPNSQHQKITV